MLISSCIGFLCWSLNLSCQKTSFFNSNTENLKSCRNHPVWLMLSLQHIKTRSMEHSLWEQYQIPSNPYTVVGTFICGNLVKKLCSASSYIIHYPNVTNLYILMLIIFLMGKSFPYQPLVQWQTAVIFWVYLTNYMP
jgi:hypothetical protein